jgi:hypothetical protein
MGAREVPPLEARRAAWDALWRILLSLPSPEDPPRSASSNVDGETPCDPGERR